MAFATPEQLKRAGLPIRHYTSKGAFEKAGGRTTSPFSAKDDRYIVSSATASYAEEDAEGGPLEAMDLFLQLQEEGWTVFVWDRGKGEGWSYENVGTDWTAYLPGADGVEGSSYPSDSARAHAAHDPNLLERVNRYRATLGRKPLAPGEWSATDLEEFLRHVPRRPNRSGRRLSQRLLR